MKLMPRGIHIINREEKKMDQKLMISFEATKEDRKYTLLAPMGAPAQEIYDFAQEIAKYLIEVSKKNAEESAQKSGE